MYCLNILVCIKQVPETRDVEVDENTGVLKREGVDSKMNPFDLYALEAGVQLKERYGGKVTVISMGPPQAAAVLKEAYMMGADAGILMSDRKFAGADTLATAFTLAQGIGRSGSFDLILCGKQTTDGDTAQVGPGIAEFLDLPHVSYVSSILALDADYITVEKDLTDGIQVCRVHLPCLLTLMETANQPRLPSYRLKLATSGRPIEVVSYKDLPPVKTEYYGLDGSPTQVERIFPPESHRDRIVYHGEPDEIANQLYVQLKEHRFI